MSEKFYIRSHMGLGDMILCNAIVRNICKKYKQVITFVKPEYEKSIKFMYRDIENLELIVTHECDIDPILNKVDLKDKIWVGFGNIEHLLENYRFDECFYRQVGLKYERRWTDFYVKRDLDTEKQLFEKTSLNKNEYIFIHDDKERGLIIPDAMLPTGIIHYRPDKAVENIFDYCTLIENAKQVHVMDSCFKHIADSLPLNNELFYHVYVRSNRNHNVTNSKLNWNYII